MSIRTTVMLTAFAAGALNAPLVPADAQPRLNPVIDLLAAKQPVFGLYAPANRRARPGGPAMPADSVKSPAQLAREALGATTSDYVFDGTMEGNFDAGYAAFTPFAEGIFAAGMLDRSPARRLKAPLFVKTPGIGADVATATKRIQQQLALGVSGIVFVDVESAAELEAGIKAMRFVSNGGTRANADHGGAPTRWGMTDGEYHQAADVWPLNPKGELVNFAIVESKEGLANIREIAAVKGIGVLFPGAGTLRGVFTSTGANGQRVFDEQAWEAAIQSVLAACKEFNVPCGYPAGEADIEARLTQGFSVFVIGWGEPGFRAVDIGRRVSGRAQPRR
jgi:2-keto-3-deoxy-L-rhamnonate aldolase RhmA